MKHEKINYSKRPPLGPYKKKGGLSWFLVGTACGSLLTYFLDPSRGNSRRILWWDKSNKFKKDSEKFLSKQWRNLTNQYIGLKAKMLPKKEESVIDDVLVARVRSKFGRAVSHTRAITVEAHDGIVTLSGAILSKEIEEVIKRVKKVPGVKKVINKLEPHHHHDNIPHLQGSGPQYLQ